MSTEDHQFKFPFQQSEEEWKSQLTPEEYDILRNKGTEYPHTGEYNHFNEEGKYACKGCGEELFLSEQKFDSSCGWPSFDDEIKGKKILKLRDTSHGMNRVEIICSNCGSHLGHIFNDGPTETRLRYCVNSKSLNFKPKDPES